MNVSRKDITLSAKSNTDPPPGKRDLSELSTLDDFLKEEGIFDEVTQTAEARVAELQAQQSLSEKLK